MGKKGKDKSFVKKRKRDQDDDGATDYVENKPSGANAASKPAVGVWKRVKVKNIQLQETGFFGLEELHIEGDPKNVDWTSLINAPTAPNDFTDAERATYKPVDTYDNENASDDEQNVPDDDAMEQDDGEEEQEDIASDKEEEEEANEDQAEEAEDVAVDDQDVENDDAEADADDADQTNEEGEAEELTPEEATDVAKWKDVFEKMHPSILRGLRDVGFLEPTGIQTEVMKPALLARKDIIGAAETGSGKTLAFMLPIMQQVMELVEKYKNKKGSSLPKDILGLVLTPTRELAMQIVEHSRAVLGKRTPIRVVPLIGGIAVPKQERLISRGAHILVATTGRLWEFLTEAHSVSLDFRHLRFLVLDEADKMIEPGRFRELSQVLRIIYTSKKIDMGLLSETEGFEQPLPEETKALLEADDEDPSAHLPPKPLQTFIFSATMALSEAARRDLRKINSAKKEAAKKKGKKNQKNLRNADPDAPAAKAKDFSDSTGILDKLMERIQFQREIELVDLTTAKIVAANIEEAKIQCLPEEKDLYLYYFLQKYKGRTLVFVNSISNIKRIVPLLAFLKVPAWPMHAAMQQRQRLKNLDRFKRTEFSVLVATDVMARGLDIPKIDHVVHYQIPPTAELYVHRSGRTARAQATGLSLCIIDPADKKNWNTITYTLKKESVKEFPVDLAFYAAVKARVEIARKLDKFLHHQQKERQSRSWLSKTANQLDLDAAEVDDGPIDDAAVKQAAVDRKRLQNEIARLRSELQWNLSRPLVPEGTSSKYYTKTTFLALKDTRTHSAQADLKQKGKVSREDKKRVKQREEEEQKGQKTASGDSDSE